MTTLKMPKVDRKILKDRDKIIQDICGLTSKKNVKRVIYPKYQLGIHKKRAEKYLENGSGPLVGFELDGGIEAGKTFIDSLKLIYHVANIGDARTLAIHPASTTHSQLSTEDQLRTGVTPGYIRLSVGIEHIDDILNDIDQAINKAQDKVKNVA